MQAVSSAARTPTRRVAQTRYRLLLLGAAGVVLTLITLVQAVHAYNTSYELFRGIVEVNSTTVDASERALQDIAQASQAAADYAVLSSATPLFEQAQTDIFRNFSNFRDEMFTLRNNLQSAEENTAFTVADTFAYSRFWRHVTDLVAQRSIDAIAQQQYLEADNHMRNWINPALQDLENLNFQRMVQAGNQAGSIIATQVILLAIPALLLALLLTYLSFRLRQQVHRYLTPGIDIAVVLSWVLLLIMLINLLNAPNQINIMIQDSYRNVSASSRTLVDANDANRAESSELLDITRTDAWNTLFDQAVQRIALRMCGQPDCLKTSFVTSGSTDQPSDQVVYAANDITPTNSTQINGIIPLMANVTVSGEATALEQARLALLDFQTADASLRTLITTNKMPDAITLNTSTDAGTSQEAFNRFVSAIDQVRDMNRAVFDQVWQSESQTLQTNRVLFGLIGYAAIALLVIVGVYQRYREL